MTVDPEPLHSLSLKLLERGRKEGTDQTTRPSDQTPPKKDHRGRRLRLRTSVASASERPSSSVDGRRPCGIPSAGCGTVSTEAGLLVRERSVPRADQLGSRWTCTGKAPVSGAAFGTRGQRLGKQPIKEIRTRRYKKGHWQQKGVVGVWLLLV